MIIKLLKDHELFGEAGEEVEVSRVRGLALIKEKIAEDPRHEKKSAAKKEKKEKAGPNAEG